MEPTNIGTEPISGESTNAPSLVDLVFGEPTSGNGEPAGIAGTGHGMQPGSMPMHEYDWEKLARIHQSERDKATTRLKEVEPMVTEYQELKNFFNALETDEEVRQAFLYELAPDLVKTKDPQTFIKEKLEKEFGKDFEPDDEEANQFGSKTWLFYKRADQLANEAFAQQTPKAPKSLQKIKEERATLAQKQMAAQKQAKEEIFKRFPTWTEATYADFLNWGRSAKETDFATLYNYMILKAGERKTQFPASISSIPGNPVLPNETINKINAMFG